MTRQTRSLAIGATVVGLIAVIICFVAIWKALGVEFTPGWGALATATVASIAVVVSGVGSWLSLRKSTQQFTASLGERAQNQQREAVVDVLHQATRWAATVGRIATEAMHVRALAALGSEEEHRLKMIQIGQEVISTHSVTAAEFDRALLTAEILTTDRAIQGHLSDLRKAFEDSFEVVTSEVEFDPRAEIEPVRVADSMKLLGSQVEKLRGSAIDAFRPSTIP